ncbi:MAG: TIGR04086 family membrane protein [Bacilli bacterium]|nr:TIGR04086 family membrane protein [Bacilli bacterium]
MLFFKKSVKPLGFIAGTIIVLTLIMTIFSFFNLISDKVVDVIKIIIPILATMLGGFLIGKRSQFKGWLEGLKLALLFIALLMLLDIIGLGHEFKLFDFIYYSSLILFTVLGSVMGINVKKK